MIVCVPFELHHFDFIILQNDTADHLEKHMPYFKKQIAMNGHNFIVNTFIEDGTIVAIVGVMRMWEGVGEIWTYISTELSFTNIFEVHKRGNELLDKVMKKYKLHRLQACILPIGSNLRFAKMFKFIEEGPLYKFDSRSRDYLRMARL